MQLILALGFFLIFNLQMTFPAHPKNTASKYTYLTTSIPFSASASKAKENLEINQYYISQTAAMVAPKKVKNPKPIHKISHQQNLQRMNQRTRQKELLFSILSKKFKLTNAQPTYTKEELALMPKVAPLTPKQAAQILIELFNSKNS